MKREHPFKAWLKKQKKKNKNHDFGYYADILGVDRSTLSRWFNGSVRPRDKQIKNACALTAGKIKYMDFINFDN